MSACGDSAALAARIYGSFPVAQSAFLRLLHLLDIEVTDAVPTAAVTAQPSLRGSTGRFPSRSPRSSACCTCWTSRQRTRCRLLR